MLYFMRLLPWVLTGFPVASSSPFMPGSQTIDQNLHGRFSPSQKPLSGLDDLGHLPNYGREKQWTGFVDVSPERRLFYWFFESRNDPENDPVLSWVNGGPGGSSMMGMLTEMGPCSVTDDSKSTVPNPYNWNNNASVIFLDQPAGTGLSVLAPGTPWPDNDEMCALDMRVFLNVFFGKIFPELASLPLHLAGESYGGHYIPSLVDLILDEREHESIHAFKGEIRSLILVNALVENTSPEIGAWRLLCSDYRGQIFNKTVCDTIASRIPECEKLTRECRLSRDLNTCMGFFSYCTSEIGIFYQDEVEAGKRNPYNIGKGCTNLPFCWDETKGNYSTYIRQPHVLQALGLPKDHPFRAVNLGLNAAFAKSKSMFASNALKVARAAENGLPILVLNGNEDFIVNTPGQVWVFDSMPWAGQTEYQAAQWKTLSDNKGFWKQTENASLVFVGIDGAGHAAPGDQKDIAADVILRWISGWNS